MQDFVPNSTILGFAAKSKIAFPNALRKITNTNFPEYPLHFSACSRHVFSNYHLKYLAQYEHPLTEKTLHFYTEKTSKPLWCYVQGSSGLDGSIVVVRTTSERMVRKALIHALNAAGYDLFGRTLDGKEGDLRGTIRVSIPKPKEMLKADFDGLVAHLTNSLIAQIIPRLRAITPLKAATPAKAKPKPAR